MKTVLATKAVAERNLTSTMGYNDLGVIDQLIGSKVSNTSIFSYPFVILEKVCAVHLSLVASRSN